jgi:hypothetical protein
MSEDARTLRRVWLLAIGLSVLPVNGAAHAACVADHPAGILQCFTTAYVNRDIDAYAQLLAPDFVFVSIGPLRQWDQDRDAELDTIRRVFASSSVESISLSFDPGYDTVPGIEPGTWKLDNLHATLVLRATADGHSEPQDFTLKVRMALHIRMVSSPIPHLEVFREEDYQPE